MLRAVWMVGVLATTALAQPAPPPAPLAPPPPLANTQPRYDWDAPTPRPDRFFFALGAVVGGSDSWLYGAYAGELGLTILPTEVRIRARAFGVLYGGTMESDWNGDFSRIGFGVEGRYCTAGLNTCMFADLDVGYQKLSLYDSSHDFVRADRGAIVGPRLGVDFGRAVRFRFALELYRHFAHHTRSDMSTEFRQFGTVGLSFAIGYQL